MTVYWCVSDTQFHRTSPGPIQGLLLYLATLSATKSFSHKKLYGGMADHDTLSRSFRIHSIVSEEDAVRTDRNEGPTRPHIGTVSAVGNKVPSASSDITGQIHNSKVCGCHQDLAQSVDQKCVAWNDSLGRVTLALNS